MLNGGKKRLYVIAAVLFLWTGAIGARLVQLQVVDYGDWLRRAQRQQQRTIEVLPPRGIIYDRNGHELAMSIKVDSIFAVPNEVTEPRKTARILGKVLKIAPDEILKRLNGARNFCWITRKVDSRTAEHVRALKLRGIYFQKEPKRFYPKRELAAQVLGYVGLDDTGLGGIEGRYDEALRGIPGRMMISMDARRTRFGSIERQPDPGQNVVLTIDEKIQYIAERELARAMQETRAEAGTIVVQNPRTGEILALANNPTFDPNVFNTLSPAQLKNRAVSDVYEPGSMFKTVTVSAALDEKITNPDEHFDVSQGFIVVGGKRMRDAHRMGVLTVAQVLAQSSNVGAIKIGLRLGEDRLYKYMRAYGFGQQTGIELPGETRGLLKPVRNWSKTSIGAMSMGQEVGITPIQAISAISAIANDGVWNAPRIVAGVTAPTAGPQSIVFHPAESRRVISTMTSFQMKKMMEGVVLFGTARRAVLDGYTSAGKTGTAQKANLNGGGYMAGKYVASFVGFAPVNQPSISVAVILDSAVGLHQGGQICAPVFSRVAQQVLEYMNVPHDADIQNPRRQVMRAGVKDSDLEEESPDHFADGLNLAEAIPDPPALRSPQAKTGTSEAVQYELARMAPLGASAEPATPPAGGMVVLDVGEGIQTPTFIGQSLRKAIETAQTAGVELEVIGSGVARAQSPEPGTRVPAGSRVAVRFSR